MSRILVLGANGQLARNTTRYLLTNTDASLRLYLRHAQRLANPDPARVDVVEGDVTDIAALTVAMEGQDVVFASLSGAMAEQAGVIIDAMHAAGLKRLIFVSSMGIYSEVPGERYKSILDPYRDSASLIQVSDLDYTILRPGWFDQNPAVDYQLTQKGQPFKGHDVSLNSISDVVAKIAQTPALHVRTSLGISRA